MSMRIVFRRIDTAARAWIDRWSIDIQPLVEWKKHLLSVFFPQVIVDAVPSWFPNALTLLRMITTPYIVWLLRTDQRVAGLVFFAFAALLDVADGEYARRMRSVSNIGRVLDPLADKVLFVSVFIVLGYTTLPLWLCATIIGLEVVLVAFGLVGWIQSRGRLKKRLRQRRLGANAAGKLKFNAQVLGTILLWCGVLHVAVPIFIGSVVLAIASIVGHFFILATNDHHH